MKILQVIAGLDPRGGGPSKVIRELSARLARSGHEVEIITTDSVAGSTRADLARGRTLHRAGYTLSVHRADLTRPPYPSVSHALDLWRRARDFDVAHIHGVFNAPSTVAAAIFRARSLPYVIRTCGMLDPWSLLQRHRLKQAYLALLDGPNLRAAARIQVSTPLEARALQVLGFGTTLALLPQGVDVPELPLPRSAVAPERPYLLFLSRVARKKGLLPLVDAFARVAATRPELDLVIAGPDEYGHRAEVVAAVTSRGLTERVRLPGMVTGDSKWRLLSGASAFVLPSHDENFGVVVIEAAHAGLPLVVSDEVGLADAVRARGAGVVCRVAAEDLAHAIERVLDDGKEAYGAQARALAQDFTWERRFPPIEAMYAEILRDARRS